LLNIKTKDFNSSELEVVTQYAIEHGGYVDLVLRQEGKFVIAVEVKVRSPESCEHHRQQLQDYSKWLAAQNEPARYLFTLVRNEDNAFHPEQYGANGRRTWSALYKQFKAVLKQNDLSDSETSLITNFCDYLESEAIVSTYKIKDLLSYAAGVQARKAVTGTFNQIASRLEAEGFKVTSKLEDANNPWPQLRIQHSRWNQIFGEGENHKITLWFCIPGTWDATQHEFFPQITLWHKDHGNDWQLAKSKLPDWLCVLKSANFNWTVYQTWRKGRENIPAEEIEAEPRQIVAWKDGDFVVLNENLLQSEDDLLNLLIDRVKQYSKLLESLERRTVLGAGAAAVAEAGR